VDREAKCSEIRHFALFHGTTSPLIAERELTLLLSDIAVQKMRMGIAGIGELPNASRSAISKL
jgi:hypothetical protein